MYAGYTELLVDKDEKILKINFNNPKKRNCMNKQSYVELGRVLREVATDDSITLVVLSGVGEYFSAGNDISTGNEDLSDVDEFVRKTKANFSQMVRAVMNCPKIILSLVNGPAIGIGATLAALSDVVWCTENAYFSTPFTKLGLIPEAGSSYLFPLIVGRSMATEMLVFGTNLNASEAYRIGFVSRIFKSSDLEMKAWPQIRAISQLPPESMQKSKELIRLGTIENLTRSFEAECEELGKRLVSEEFMNALVEFAMRKNKSKL